MFATSQDVRGYCTASVYGSELNLRRGTWPAGETRPAILDWGFGRHAARTIVILFLALTTGDPAMGATSEVPGMVKLVSHHSVVATIDRLEAALKQRGILIFARIDFSGDAGRANLALRPEQMLIFGNPRAGTPLMLAVPAAGLDLPIKVVAWEDAEGKVWAAYNQPEYIIRRYGLPADLAANLSAVVPLIEAAAAE
jgi:uncharacterized protein (DUF302 family)